MTIEPDKTNKAFRKWRRRMDYTQMEAAKILELAQSTVKGYDCGKRWNPHGPVLVPKVVLLACKCVELNQTPVE